MIIITGIAGFIGFHVAQALVQQQPAVPIIGIDNFNSYYNPVWKRKRAAQLMALSSSIKIIEGDCIDGTFIQQVFAEYPPSHVIHLAAQAGVRYSLDAPHKYIDSNITGFLNILEACRQYPPQHLLYASSSSVYGLNAADKPFAEGDKTDSPASLYGATKKANEAMAHAYQHLFGIPATGMRFFTVYGEWGRPDMALFKFAEAMTRGQPIPLYNHGQMQRDFTYISDAVRAVLALLPLSPVAHRLVNIGGNQPVALLDMVALLEQQLGVTPIIQSLPMQQGDVMATCADTTVLQQLTGWQPQICLAEGIARFVAWFKQHGGTEYNK